MHVIHYGPGMAEITKHSRLSTGDREKLGTRAEKAYAAGRSLREISEELGTSAGRVRAILLERGTSLRGRGGNVRKPDPERGKLAKQVAAEYAKGATFAELAQRHGKSASTIRNLVQAGGGASRPRGGRSTKKK